MKTRTNKFLTLLIIAAVSLFSITLASCSDDDDGVVKVNFNADTVEGTWQVLQMDSIEISDDANMSIQHRTFQSIQYDNRYISFHKGGTGSTTGNYDLYETSSNGRTEIENGTYNIVESSFRIELSSGLKLHFLKSDNQTMTLESYNANNGTHRARYTLQRSSK